MAQISPLISGVDLPTKNVLAMCHTAKLSAIHPWARVYETLALPGDYGKLIMAVPADITDEKALYRYAMMTLSGFSSPNPFCSRIYTRSVRPIYKIYSSAFWY